jgi:hypothetical protein
MATISRNSELLHRDLLERGPLTRRLIRDPLLGHLGRLAATARSTSPRRPKSLSVVIRSRNNVEALGRLLDDIDSQRFGGSVEVVVVDSESHDGSVRLAQTRGARVVELRQASYSHPRALNAGFALASHEWVLSLVEHSLLAHRRTFDVANLWSGTEGLAALSGTIVPGVNASKTERAVGIPVANRILRHPPLAVQRDGMGVLATNCSLFRRSAWESLGGFDERYGAGGEDGAFCRAALEGGWVVMVEPALCVCHSHGLGPVDGVRQLRHWAEFGEPTPFSLERLLSYRRDLSS